MSWIIFVYVCLFPFSSSRYTYKFELHCERGEEHAVSVGPRKGDVPGNKLHVEVRVVSHSRYALCWILRRRCWDLCFVGSNTG